MGACTRVPAKASECLVPGAVWHKIWWTFLKTEVFAALIPYKHGQTQKTVADNACDL
jgi:hypothetical protein